ncbi:ABC transporter ATP-binding protein [Erythrobacter sp. LQ02-29]|uniref:ATP-binding cassette domain-containing protein n=1 Tax=Erythrobacter sp. LQ02-29 TaxID=2920384 RepID=UPI001F4DFEFF|nr:ABC transporter ATP-binding protein [Erythrobacter sp. LQ02-29]MCP9222289.1 ABC transporter ATP-binding protein [Erythrobacter sp. LQ02-29]
MTAAVALSNAAVKRGGALVTHEIALSVSPGSWFGLIGANGSGKTSLLRALGGRLPFAGGSCLLDGLEVAGDRAGRARHFGFAPPPDTLPDMLRVREVLELVSGSGEAYRARLEPLWQALGLDGLMERWIGECSAGMRQRAAIATAFAGEHAAVILDEPFNWLDPVAAFDLRRALRAMVDDGLTLITALHDLGTLAAACDTGVMLADGRCAMELSREMLAAARRDPLAFESATIDRLRSRTAGR